MRTIILTVVAFIACVLSSPTPGGGGGWPPPSPPPPKCTSFTDTYDNITASPVPQFSDITYYGGLLYHGWVASPIGVGGSNEGIIPASPPNLAVATLTQDLLQLGSLTLSAYGFITTAGTGTKSFTLSSFYFGCALDLHTPENPAGAEGCVVAAVGYNTSGHQVGVATFGFTPAGLIAPVQLAILPPTFSGLINVTIGVSSAAVSAVDTTLYLDNVTHCNYY